MTREGGRRALLLHVGVVAILFGLGAVLPDYQHGTLASVLVLAVFAMGYNLLFGYTGLLSLGHAMFFSAGLYGAGLTLTYLGWSSPAAFLAGLACGLVLSVVVGALALRTTGVAFMIVTMMFAQIFYLATLYFTTWTRGEEGLVLQRAARAFSIGPVYVDLADPGTRYLLALALYASVLFATLWIARAPFGRVLVAIRENEERTRMLGYDTFAAKLAAVVLSGTISAASGAAYALLFGYIGSTFASVQYSILPLLWVLLGGAATTFGPLVGPVAMFYLIETSSDLLNAYLPQAGLSHLGIVGAALILLVLFFPAGLVGWVRKRYAGWLP